MGRIREMDSFLLNPDLSTDKDVLRRSISAMSRAHPKDRLV